MISLVAEACDATAAGPVDGTVAYLFDRACYLRRPAGGLVLIVSAETGAMPDGIVVGLPPRFRFSDTLAAGNAARLRGGVLRIGSDRLTIDLRPARRVPAALPLDAIDPPSIASAISHTTKGLERSAAAVAPEAEALFAGRVAGDAPIKVLDWLGKGPGLTPAGDDFLVGAMAAERFAAGAGIRTPITPDVLANLSRTGELSRTLLTGAARGVFPDRLARLAVAIGSGQHSDALDKALGRLIGFGHSSGASMAYGLVEGYKSVLGWRSGACAA